MAWSVDRLGRSLQDLVGFLSELHAYGIDLFLHQQGLDTTTPSGRMMFQMLGVFSEFERAMIRERVKSGLERAKAQGKTLGRPRIDPTKEGAIRADLRAGRESSSSRACMGLASGPCRGSRRRSRADLSTRLFDSGRRIMGTNSESEDAQSGLQRPPCADIVEVRGNQGFPALERWTRLKGGNIAHRLKPSRKPRQCRMGGEPRPVITNWNLSLSETTLRSVVKNTPSGA